MIVFNSALIALIDNFSIASEMLILELRQGKLGRFTLDRYEELSV
jgi:ribosome biogenesis GTPase A